MYAIGQRVFVVAYATEDTIFVFGHGTFEGRFLPPDIAVEGPERFKTAYRAARLTTPDMPEEISDDMANAMLLMLEGNPRIKLENGKTIWGYECWWGTDEEFKNDIEGVKIVEIDIDDARAEVRKQQLSAVN